MPLGRVGRGSGRGPLGKPLALGSTRMAWTEDKSERETILASELVWAEEAAGSYGNDCKDTSAPLRACPGGNNDDSLTPPGQARHEDRLDALVVCSHQLSAPPGQAGSEARISLRNGKVDGGTPFPAASGPLLRSGLDDRLGVTVAAEDN